MGRDVEQTDKAVEVWMKTLGDSIDMKVVVFKLDMKGVMTDKHPTRNLEQG